MKTASKPALVRLDAVVAVSYAGEGHAEQLTKKRKAELEHIIKTAMSQSKVPLSSGEHSEFDDAAPGKKLPGFGGAPASEGKRGFTDWDDAGIHRYANGWWDDKDVSDYINRVANRDTDKDSEKKLRIDLLPIPKNARGF